MSELGDRESTETPAAAPALPKPVIKRMHWPFPIIWIVPVIAAVLAGYYLYEHHREGGVEIKMEFADAGGITPDQTFVQVHGVVIGKVKSVDLSNDHERARITVRLDSRYSFIAQKETAFWVVRPELSLESITGLNALVTGPYIEARAGEGEPTKEFKGLPRAPLMSRPGVKFVLHAERLGDLTLNSPITYRGIQVGLVQDIRLSNVADAANVTVFIWQPYTVLVRTTSGFWKVKAADIKGGLFSGLKLDINSIRSLLTGSIEFATPDNAIGKPAPPTAEFILNEAPKDEWLRWKPKIELTPKPAEPPPAGVVPNSGSPALPAPQQKH